MGKENYKISFFKPANYFSRFNRNLVIILAIIWAVAIFGFQILLRVVQKPTPEPSLAIFEKAWNNIENGNPSTEDKINFASSVLSVLGKSTIISAPDKQMVLVNAISWVVYDITPEAQREYLIASIDEFNNIKENISSFNDEAYISAKENIISQVAPLINEKEYSLKAKLLPFVLDTGGMVEFSNENKENILGVMKLYLTHNRSFLTDTIFLGFPFHYFYTAIFLLVLFVVLCWIYTFMLDRVHARIGTYKKNDTKEVSEK